MDVPTCDACGGVLLLSEASDATFCTACDRWLEPACFDQSCRVCRGRPERPSQADDLEASKPWE